MSTTVSNFSLTIDGNRSERFLIEIDGKLYKLEDFSLSQRLMAPNTLRFAMRKGPDEDSTEPQFAACGSIIGKDIELSLETVNFEKLSGIVQDDDKTADITFKGIITSVSSSRSLSEYIIYVEAQSYDALLIDNPTCKSFEDKTLNDIVGDVADDYEKIAPHIDARFAETLPYTVQYNETNYDFLARLATRFGEWFYNDGERMVFGKLPKGEPVVLGYPDKDVPQYSVDMRLQHTAFSHVASSYNAYDSSRKEGLEEMGRSYNNLADIIFGKACDLFIKPTLQNLHSGGFADNDGRDTLLSVSTKTQGRGEKAGMLVYTGTTYCSRLRIGNTLIIRDNILSNDMAGCLSDIDQDEILITELTHTFSENDMYANTFTGIPAACDYPPYSNSDVYAHAPSCRATVTDTEDPSNLGRVRVQFPWQAQLGDGSMTPWLRISQPYAGRGKGFSFIPEKGEEVMVDFEGGNADRPYVKGTLFNGVGTPDGAWLPGNNRVKAIRTRNGHTIEIWDEGPGGYIRIYDHGKKNYILTFSTDEKLIKLESTGNIELYAKNDIIMRAGHDINAGAGNDIFIAAGHDKTENIGKDCDIIIAGNRRTTIDKNDEESVGQNSLISIGENMDLSITHQYQNTSETNRTEATDKLMLYSKTHHQKAKGNMNVEADGTIEINGLQCVKIN